MIQGSLKRIYQVMQPIKDGTLNPQWLQSKSSADELFSKIKAYFLPGSKIRQDVQCQARYCVMPTRLPGAVKEEYNPMMLCYFCDRPFHAGCYNLDAALIKEEKVPWKCEDCRSNISNEHATKFFNVSKGYKLSLKERRSKYLRESVIPDDKPQFALDTEFEVADKESFKRRALQVASQADLTMNLSMLDEASEIEVLQHSIMRSKADELRAHETSKRVMAELEAEQRRTKEASNEIEFLRRQIEMMRNGIKTQPIPLIAVTSPGTSADTHPTIIQSASANETLTSQYTAGNTTARIEQNNYVYEPQPIQQQRSTTFQNYAPGNEETGVSNLLTRLTTSQERDEERKLLAMRRKAVPKIIEFNGDSNKWLAFKQDVERYRVNCQFDDETIKLYLRGALKGEAFQLVKDLFDRRTLDHIMEVLKLAYGDEMMLIRKRSEELRQIKIDSHLYRSEVVKLQAAIQGYFAACNYAGLGYLNSNELGEAVFAQFGPEDRQRCKEYCRTQNPGTIVISIQGVYDYLLNRLPLLDDIPVKYKDKSQHVKYEKSDKKTFQINYAANSSSTPEDKEAYKFELRDKCTARYMGYDMTKLNSMNKKCEFCGRASHFSFQCSLYRAMNEEDRFKAIIEKNLCRSCLVTTTHRAIDCDLKTGCGMKVGRISRCSQKHHITIHKAILKSSSTTNRNRRRPNTNANTQNAAARIREAENIVDNNVIEANTGFHAAEPEEAQRNYNVVPVMSNVHGSIDRRRTVKVFKLNFIGPKGKVTEYAIGDSGSEVSLMRDDLRQALGIEGTKRSLCLQWSDNTKKTSSATRIDLILQGVSKGCKQHKLKDCFAVNSLNLPARSLNMETLRELYPHLREAEFDSYNNIRPVMLIGSPHAYLIEGDGKLLENGEEAPVALSTKLGWTVYGGSSSATLMLANMQDMANSEAKSNGATELDETQLLPKVTNEQLNDMLEYFNSIESLGIKSKEIQLTEKEKNAIAILEEEMRVMEDGKIEVPLIWDRSEKEIPSLPNNYPMVLQRQINQETKLRKNPDQLKAYNDNVKELLDLGFLRYATDEDMKTKWPNVWYLPMSLIENSNKVPPKRRIVYDASATYKSTSLNSKLLKGPDLLVNILQPLLKMRMSKYAFTADVSKMFHMMRLTPRDQQCQRILYRERHNEPMKTLILSVMSFGPTSSPFTSQYVKNWNADRWKEVYPVAADTLKHYTYMDDVLTSESTLPIAIETAKQCIKICDDIGWKLTNFQSNSVELLQALPESNVKKDLIPLLESETERHVTKVLGCNWNTKSDCFEFNLDSNLFVKLVNEFNQRPTKRDQASTIARIYDNLGLISNYTILGKILLQRSWQRKLDWDEAIPEAEAKLWKEWLHDINNIARIQFNRQYTSLNSITDADKIELHTFCDAGGEAYGAVSYLVVRKGSSVESNIVMAKAKVTPLRLKSKTTICEMPRLELIAALTAARLSDTIRRIYSQLKMTRYFWSDSEVVLRWILNPNHKLVKYAISPVEEILEMSERKEWRYVPTKLNPADLCTKFKKFDVNIASTIWMAGPEFMKLNQEEWPAMPENLYKNEPLMANNICIQKLNFSTHELPPVDCPRANDSAIDKLRPAIKASWMKLLRATARTLKIYWDGFVPVVMMKRLENLEFLKKLRKLMRHYREITSMDLERAEHFIFRKIQRETYPEEYKLLQDGKKVRNKEFRQLNVFMDEEGILRINSRVNLNSPTFPQQFAPFLPRKNAIVSTFLLYYHQKFKHIGLESQIAEIRTRCWIPQLRSAMRSIKSKCNECNLRNARPYAPIMAPLPDYRTNPAGKPFEVTGIDVMGPIIVNRSKKIYILIFACALTRYVHLHILESLESIRVLEAIVVFWTAYGPIKKIVSDNGTNFRGAANLLREEYENSKIFLQQQATALQPKLSELYGLEWEFISAYAPWFGGMYERLIQEVKRSLYDTLNNRKLQKVELNIAIHETAHRMNCRPLVENSIDAADEEILTPHHLVKNRSGWPLLAGIHKNKYVQVNDRSLYRRGRILADEIMRKFVSYHLPTLTKRTKWHDNEEPIKLDDLVLMIEPNQTRMQWPRGRVIKLHPGRDGNVRSADIVLACGKIKLNRAVRNLAKINISSHPADEIDSNNHTLSINCTFFSDSSSLPQRTYHLQKLIASERINFNFKPLLLSFEQVTKTSQAIEMTRRKRSKKSTPTAPHIVKLANIPTTMPLSEVVEVLIDANVQTIVAMFRAADYHEEILDTEVFTYIIDKEEAEILVGKDSFMIGGRISQVSKVNAIAGIAEFPVDIGGPDGSSCTRAPYPVAIFKLKPVPRFLLSVNIRQLLFVHERIVHGLNDQKSITGMRLIYDETEKRSRSFGFLSVLTRMQMRACLYKDRFFQGVRIKTDYTNVTQVLLPQKFSHLFNERHRCEMTPEVIRENLLNFDIRSIRVTFPIVPTASSTSIVNPESFSNVQNAEKEGISYMQSPEEDEDKLSAYTPPLPYGIFSSQPAIDISEGILKKAEKKIVKKAGKRKYVKFDTEIDNLSTSVSGLSLGDDYTIDESGEISKRD